MSISRRQLLWRGASLAAFGALGALAGCGNDPSVTPFPLPPAPSPAPPPLPVLPAFPQPAVRKSGNGTLDTQLRVDYSEFTVDGKALKLRSYENSLVGPTLRVRPGDKLKIKLINDLPPNPDQNAAIVDMNIPHHMNSTNLHTHGLHVSPAGKSDNIFVVIDPGDDFQYEYDIPADHPAGTFWYHAHKHGSSTVQALSGMAGALIVEGGLDLVPEVAAARDLVFLVAELNTDPATGEVPDFTIVPGGGPFSGTRNLLVNGEVRPKLHVYSGEVVRLRIINGSPRRAIPFVVDFHNVEIVALDGITLPNLRSAASVALAPANRADVLIRAGAPGTYAIRKQLDSSQPVADPEVILAFLEVHSEALPMQLPGALPVPANLPDILSSEVTNTRVLRFNQSAAGGPGNAPRFSIDGALFNPAVVNHTIPLNAVEEWELINESAQLHPFHIHVNPFQVISINGVPLPQPEWRDTIDLPKATGQTPGRVVIRHRFQDFKGLFVLHCHILVHEDLGMMQVVNVI